MTWINSKKACKRILFKEQNYHLASARYEWLLSPNIKDSRVESESSLFKFIVGHTRTRKNVFSRKKSQSLIFEENFSLYIWYITIYKNDTFLKIAREVSSKYHKIGRSIIKKPANIIQDKRNSIQNKRNIERNASTIPTNMVTHTHVHGYGWPRTRVCVTKTMGSHTQSLGQPCPT